MRNVIEKPKKTERIVLPTVQCPFEDGKAAACLRQPGRLGDGLGEMGRGELLALEGSVCGEQELGELAAEHEEPVVVDDAAGNGAGIELGVELVQQEALGKVRQSERARRRGG